MCVGVRNDFIRKYINKSLKKYWKLFIFTKQNTDEFTNKFFLTAFNCHIDYQPH